jgi:hypothetical protein
MVQFVKLKELSWIDKHTLENGNKDQGQKENNN